MKFVCRVYWEMCRDVEVEVDEKVFSLRSRQVTEAIEKAMEKLDINYSTTPGAEFVPDSINCDPTTDVQVIK